MVVVTFRARLVFFAMPLTCHIRGPGSESGAVPGSKALLLGLSVGRTNMAQNVASGDALRDQFDAAVSSRVNSAAGLDEGRLSLFGRS